MQRRRNWLLQPHDSAEFAVIEQRHHLRKFAALELEAAASASFSSNKSVITLFKTNTAREAE